MMTSESYRTFLSKYNRVKSRWEFHRTHCSVCNQPTHFCTMGQELYMAFKMAKSELERAEKVL